MIITAFSAAVTRDVILRFFNSVSMVYIKEVILSLASYMKKERSHEQGIEKIHCHNEICVFEVTFL